MRLRDYKQWCLWRIDTKQDGTRFKRPINQWGDPISVTQHDEFADWGVVNHVVETKRIHTQGAAFIFTESDPFVGIDLDKCLEDYTPKEWVLPILERFRNTYIEYSPSFKGLKIYCIGKKPSSRCNAKVADGAIECYSERRFFTFTGDRFPGAGEEVIEQQEAIDWLFREHLPSYEPLIYKPSLDLVGNISQRARNYAAKIERPLPGGRNLKCFKLAGHLFAMVDLASGEKLDDREVEELVHVWNNSLPEPMTAWEVDRCIDNARKSPSPRELKMSAPPMPKHESDPDIDLSGILGEQPAAPIQEEEFPAELLDVPGMIGEFVAYCERTCIAKQPALALGAGICLQAVLAGRKVVDSLNNRPNIYIIGTAETGTGKENPRQMIERILRQADGTHLGGADNPRSGSALVALLQDSPAKLLMIDEIGRYFRSNKAQDRMSHQAEVIDQLLKLYSQGEGVWAGAQYAESKRNMTVDRPQLSLFGTTVPEHLWANMEMAQATDGFLSRVILIEGNDTPEDGEMEPLTPPPESILEHCRAWINRAEGNLAGNQASDSEQVIQHTDAAKARLKEIRQQAKDRNVHQTREELALASRLMQNTAKLALIYACSRDVRDPIIDLDAVNWGFALSDYSRKKVLHACGFRICESQFAKRQQKVIEWMRSKKGGVTSLGEYTYKWKNWRPIDREEVLRNMKETGMVVTTEEENPDTNRVRIILRLTIQ